MRAGMEDLVVRLSSAEEGLASAKSSIASMNVWASQAVPLAEVQLMLTKLNGLQKHTEQAALADAEKAAKAESEQLKVIERLNQMLTMQQEECSGLKEQLQVCLFEILLVLL